MSQQLQEFGQTNEAGQTAYTRWLTKQAGVHNMAAALNRQYFIADAQAAPVHVPTPTPDVVANPVMSQEVTTAVPVQRTAPEAVAAIPAQTEAPVAPEAAAQPAPDQLSVEQLSRDAYDLAA